MGKRVALVQFKNRVFYHQKCFLCDCFQAEGENEVNNELANRISLFYADATPMLKTLSDGTTKFVSEVRRAGVTSEPRSGSNRILTLALSLFTRQNKNLPIENTTDCLSTMATVCKVMLETP